MSQLSLFDLNTLHAIADETREHVASTSHDIGRALDINSAFREYARPESELLRALVLNGVVQAASLTGATVARGHGTVTLAMSTVASMRLFRVLKGKKAKGGGYHVPANKSSAWGADAMLDIAEHWVLGYHLDEESGTLGDLFAAEVIGSVAGLPGSLSLSDAVLLGSAPPTGTFAGDDEDTLPGFETVRKAQQSE